MPIKPENKALYPVDWPAIRGSILQRAQMRCEHPGCGARQYDVGYWAHWGGGPLQWFEIERNLPTYAQAKQRAAEIHFERYGDGPAQAGEHKIIVVVLTVAHLNHQPEDCRPENLAAMCQRHHLAYDHEHHKVTAYRTRKEAAQTADLFAAMTT